MSFTMQPGMEAPMFSALAQTKDKMRVLVFFPAGFVAEQQKKLELYFAKNRDFNEKGVSVIYISDTKTDVWQELIGQSSETNQVFFESDLEHSIAQLYGLISDQGSFAPAVFIIDTIGNVRKVYDSEKYPDLPNPAAVFRVINKFNELPKPLPVSENDHIYGAKDAKITLIKYGDYQCKPCAQASPVIQAVMEKYATNARFVFRHLPLRNTHPLAQEAAEAVEAAGNQGKFWEAHYALYALKGELQKGDITGLPAKLDLDVERFQFELEIRKYQETVNFDFKNAVKNKIKLPATLLINGELFEGAKTVESISQRIEALKQGYAAIK
jgi:protein-disulfide isomerase/peroxiredoxin